VGSEFLFAVYQLVLEADGYQPYLFSPEKGLKALIRKALDLAKDPAKICVDEVLPSQVLKVKCTLVYSHLLTYGVHISTPKVEASLVV
jgi:hypothetical protein